jgi:hypothetical protein
MSAPVSTGAAGSGKLVHVASRKRKKSGESTNNALNNPLNNTRQATSSTSSSLFSSTSSHEFNGLLPSSNSLSLASGSSTRTPKGSLAKSYSINPVMLKVKPTAPASKRTKRAPATARPTIPQGQLPEPIQLDSGMLQCPQCPQKLGHQSTYMRHIRTHQNSEKPFKCDICEHRFGVKWNLDRHMLRHTGDSKIKCKVCNRQFTENWALKRHMKVHQKGFRCRGCDFSGETQAALDVHILTHKEQNNVDEKEGPQFCAKCGYKCSNTIALRKHARIHDRKCACPDCGAKFRDNANLNRHRKGRNCIKRQSK